MANWQVISLDTTTPQLRAPGTGDGYSFNSGSTQLGVWTTTGLGIGTASPSTKLQVIGNTKVGTGAASNSATFMVNNPNATATGIQLFQDSQESWVMGLLASNTALTWANSGSEKMRLDTVGQLGIGTTNPQAKLHVAAGNILIDNNRAISALDSAGTAESVLSVTTANNLTIASPTLSGSIQYAVRNASGVHQFSIAGTERARIDSSGRLLVGGTSAVVGSANGSIEVQNANTILMGLTSFTAASSGPNIFFSKSRGATVGTNTIVQSGDTVGAFVFRGANGTGYDDAAYIIGSVDGTPGASADMPGRLSFWTSADGSASPTERARITSGGSLLVKRTTVLDSGQIGLDFDGINNNGIAINDTASATGSGFIKFLTGGTVRGSVTNNNNTGVLYNLTSDERLKKNIADAGEFGEIIDAIQVRKFDWKENDSHTRAGFVAQELLTVAPEAVYQPNNEEEMMGVDYSKLVPMLVKEIQSLRARVAQLEAK